MVFSEDFEHFNLKNWDTVTDTPGVVEIVDGGRAGKCAQLTATPGRDTGGYLYKVLDPGLETCHLRFYVKFDKDHGYTHHFAHLCGYNPPTRWPQGGAGRRPAGDAQFSTGIEPDGNWFRHPPPGVWHFYSYWNGMKAALTAGSGAIRLTPIRPSPCGATSGSAWRSWSSATTRPRPTASRRRGSTARRSAGGAGSAGARTPT